MNWVMVLLVSHWVFACLLLAISFVHKGYALRQSCRWAAMFYFLGLFLKDVPEPPHWIMFVGLDLACAAVLLRLSAPTGAVWALYVSAVLGALNGLEVAGVLLYDMFEPLALTVNLAFVYYLAILPRIRPRDRRATDRLPVH